MIDRELHIISFDIPYPADYGGVIDVFYKIKALSELGIRIHLHCYFHHRRFSNTLESLCETVNYYPRTTSILKQISKTPFIIKSRNSRLLLHRLNEKTCQILFEGLHTTAVLLEDNSIGMRSSIRTHNVEHHYYKHLMLAESNILKRIYYYLESKKLKPYQKLLKKAKKIITISSGDYHYFRQRYNDKVSYIPAFHPYTKVTSITGIGKHMLYHGNLSVIENEKAAMFLIKKVMPGVSATLVIAGKNPTKKLRLEIAKHSNIQLVENPDQEKMQQLIKDAQIHLLPTFQPTGVKLKLVASLYEGRHIIANDQMTKGFPENKLIFKANKPEEFRNKIQKLFNIPFTEGDIAARTEFLNEHFNNQKNALQLTKEIYNYRGDAAAHAWTSPPNSDNLP
ncbi:MAG TPA: glycosyltransferase family 4 protein [Bacteroidia bacterium]|nr:glycosyltransferase family 4 protein [Bacteroidia bacterium]HQF29141.1 glycosyltransferase family 4 protein [Bacteroidia bacterium]HQK98471.1 glycosyltransferase family 4 protein [Bacteroidia bacterium]